MDKKDIASLNLQELETELKAMGLPKFRAKQIYDWIHKKGVTQFSEMTTISKDLICKLNDNFVIFSCTIEKKLVSRYDNTVKYLYSLPDGEVGPRLAEEPLILEATLGNLDWTLRV